MGISAMSLYEVAVVAAIIGFMIGFIVAAAVDGKTHKRDMDKLEGEYRELHRKYYDATGDGLPPPDETEPYKTI